MPRSGYGLMISYDRRKRHVRVKRLKGPSKYGNKNMKRPQMLVCRLCSSSEVNDLDLGELLTKENITVHYFCLLLASGLYQNGRMSDKKAIKGFLKQDILKEVKRGSRLKCCYCRGKGATIGCCMTACKKVFHLPCGRSHGTLHQFFDTFGSFCELHRPQQRVSVSDRLSFRGTAKATCAICLSAVDARSSTGTIRSPCCKNAWFHHSCMQKYAVSAGQYFFKCPVCSSNRNFQSEMLNFGIYIPVQDASWEREPNAYSELLVRHSSCDAPVCKCPQGRNFDAEVGEFDLILCEFCGSFGTHVACHGLTIVDNFRLCPICSGFDEPDPIEDVTRASDNVKFETKRAESDMDVGSVEGRSLRSRIVAPIAVFTRSRDNLKLETSQAESDMDINIVEGRSLRSRIVAPFAVVTRSRNNVKLETSQGESDTDVGIAEGRRLRSRFVAPFADVTRSSDNMKLETGQVESDMDVGIVEGRISRSRVVAAPIAVLTRSRDNMKLERSQAQSDMDVGIVNGRSLRSCFVGQVTICPHLK